jgi:Kelch motif protein
MIRINKYKFKAIGSLLFVGLSVIGLLATTATPALAAGTFQKTGSMNVARVSHTATLLANGQVLVAGGDNSTLGSSPLASAELYNPATGKWTLTGSMTVPRESHQAVLLQNGQVLVAGGTNASGTLTSAELYNPATGTWSATGSMSTARSGFSTTVLQNGQVLAWQGTSAELYNPATGTWSATGGPTSSVGGANSALLQNGKVLAIGLSLNTPSELYDPSTGTWSTTGSTGTTMLNPITPEFSNGEVLATGSFASGTASDSSSSLYDPSTGQFTLEAGPCSCRAFTGAMLQTDQVLVVGGAITRQAQPYPITLTVNSAELWSLSTQSWTSTGNLHDSRSGATVTVLQNGQALVAGGGQSTKQTNGFVILASAELYTP